MPAKKDHKKIQAFIRKNHGQLNTREMAVAMDVSEGYICLQRKEMGLKSKPVRCKRKAPGDDIATRTMIKEALAGEFSLGWLRKPWTGEGVG